ncbi:hypothetical protein HI806_01005 [Ralstonia solanacearum]|uniref:hypothetical protein n=1 Tax=Ralstonia pseudosolanacearum TaxID=1310165 RepID=UPI0005786C7B|nr:hypothetical protein [Ralstonia pseudosolanacearum]APF85464.1 hypothetical protein BCR16_00930 [Ralstonia solanacearum FJAT-1458]QKL69958.1 hypothetical protein HI806_01005 [Ralstonia solanacearum]OAI65760.1 hypothetical protein RSP781_15685 [Ralstonia pseudosolanacearum]QKL75170.1 hypothetical protein HI805_01005 [Ralstonia solanacearum]QKL80373.1 hypothetical protein HI804_01010 [Ralstonia solanacearum]
MPFVKSMTLMLLSEKERRFRDWIDWRYHDLTRRRVDAARKAREAEERKRQEIAAAAAALKKQREDLLNSAMNGRDRADRLRTLVSEVEASLTAEGHADERFVTWKLWVLGEADAIDLRKRTGQELLQWLDGFQLY